MGWPRAEEEDSDGGKIVNRLMGAGTGEGRGAISGLRLGGRYDPCWTHSDNYLAGAVENSECDPHPQEKRKKPLTVSSKGLPGSARTTPSSPMLSDLSALPSGKKWG